MIEDTLMVAAKPFREDMLMVAAKPFTEDMLRVFQSDLNPQWPDALEFYDTLVSHEMCIPSHHN